MSAVGHGLAAVALLWMPRPEAAALPGVVTVDLVALAAPAAATPPRAPAPRPVEAKPVAPAPIPPPVPVQAEPVPPRPDVPKPEPPKPEPAKPAPPPPPRNEVVIPKQPERPPEKPKAKPAPPPEPEAPQREVAKVEPPKPKPTPPPPKPAPKQESYEDLLAELRAERGESRPDRVERPARTAAVSEAPAGAGRDGAPASPEITGWVRAVAVHLSRAWILPPEMRSRRLMTELLVDLDAQGNLLSEPRVVRGSGDARFDDNAVRAVRKASPLPAPPDAGVWTIGFCPECRG